MLNLRSHHKPRISNRLAFFAALILVVSSLASVSDSVISTSDQAVKTAAAESSGMDAFSSQASGGNTRQKNKSFKVSLFLFRID
jgi:hypothetical protein